jgi:glucose-6-phosphate isomerase
MKQEKIRLDFNNMLAEFIGGNGITIAEVDRIAGKIKAAAQAMEQKRDQMAWRDLPHNQADIVEDILAYAAAMRSKIKALVVFGIGGSALGPIALQQAIHSPYYNICEKLRGDNPQLFVADNIDPATISHLLQMVDLRETLFSVVSKSGSTSETMAQFMIIKDILERGLGRDAAKDHIVCTTDRENGNLIKIARAEGYKTFYIPAGVGGRFSQLCPVGLLPAALCGIDIKQLLAGAAYMDQICKSEDFWQNPAYVYAILHYIAMKNGKNISVMMPYADSLKYISDWYAQLWAESLGKKYDNNGNVVNVGQTPVKALGVTDQHSQVQLYMEGPFDKVMVFVGVDGFPRDVPIPKSFEDIPSLGFLGGHSLAALLLAEQAATEYALQQSGRMNMTITLPEVNEHTIGQTLYMLEVATAFAGELLNIDAFDQPGVEEGKNATYAYFGRPGYDAKKAEMDAAPKKNPKYVI